MYCYETELNQSFAFLLQEGFKLEESYEKSTDTACVYLFRFLKNGNCLEFRGLAGEQSGSFVVRLRGEVKFPNLKLRYPKLFRAWKIKHLFHKATVPALWEFAAQLLREEKRLSGTYFGIE